jgi:hypothetical protein
MMVDQLRQHGYVLETARTERLPLLTLDRGLARAAQKLGMKLKEF